MVVDDPDPSKQVWVPSLLCRSECDRHLTEWDKCVENVAADPDVKETFDTQMAALVGLCRLLCIICFRRFNLMN